MLWSSSQLKPPNSSPWYSEWYHLSSCGPHPLSYDNNQWPQLRRHSTSSPQHSPYMLFLSIAYLASKAHCRTNHWFHHSWQQSTSFSPQPSYDHNISRTRTFKLQERYVLSVCACRKTFELQRLFPALPKSGNAATLNVLPKTRPHSSTLGPYPLMFDGSPESRLDHPVHIRITLLNFKWVLPCFDFLRHPLMKVLGLVSHCFMLSYDCAFSFHYSTHLIILLCLCHLRLYFVYIILVLAYAFILSSSK